LQECISALHSRTFTAWRLQIKNRAGHECRLSNDCHLDPERVQQQSPGRNNTV
jgi:hypothetical protein